MNFKFCDMKGLEIDDGIDLVEFCYILDGNMLDKYLVKLYLNFYIFYCCLLLYSWLL